MSNALGSRRLALLTAPRRHHTDKAHIAKRSGTELTAASRHQVRFELTWVDNNNIDFISSRNYILNYLATRLTLQSFVSQALIALLAKITKYGWFDSFKDELIFRKIDLDVKEFLKGSVEHCMIGVKILSQLTSEMNQIAEMDVNLSFTRHRKIACSFRDTQLFDIFLLSCELLARARDNSTSLNLVDEAQQG